MARGHFSDIGCVTAGKKRGFAGWAAGASANFESDGLL
jgi:hypothetical protein